MIIFKFHLGKYFNFVEDATVSKLGSEGEVKRFRHKKYKGWWKVIMRTLLGHAVGMGAGGTKESCPFIWPEQWLSLCAVFMPHEVVTSQLEQHQSLCSLEDLSLLQFLRCDLSLGQSKGINDNMLFSRLFGCNFVGYFHHSIKHY